MKVLILDDETGRALTWKAFIETLGVEAEAPEQDAVSKIIKDLQELRLKARNAGNVDFSSPLDNYDLLIIDYDLLGLRGGEGWTTGAEVAYAARLLTKVGPIMVINQYGTNSFDLTMKRSLSSKADYDVGSDQIMNPGLWRSSDFNGFRPWSWPNLLTEPARFELMTKAISHNIDKKISEFLSIEFENADSPRFVNRELCGYLGIKNDTTFSDILTASNDGRIFHVIDKDKPILEKLSKDNFARIAASVVWRWLEKIVLPCQGVLCDIPHLATQVPWILKDWANANSWKQLGQLDTPEGLASEVEGSKFKLECMFSRPVYWGEEIKNIAQPPNDFSIANLPKLDFCEDISNFVETQSATEFPTDLPTFDNKRFVKHEHPEHSGAIYEPQSYLLM